MIALKEQNDNDQLEAYGGNAEALLRVQKTFRIEPKLLQVGIFRVEKLKNKMVAFGRVDDLGRIVIPKEIRRTLKIREGDPLSNNIDTNRQILYGDT